MKTMKSLAMMALIGVLLASACSTVPFGGAAPSPTPSSSATPGSPPTNTAALQPTATDNPALTPTIDTSFSAEAPDPSWKLFFTEQFSLWLPATYIGGDVDQTLDLIIDYYREIGREDLVQSVRASADALLMLAIDTERYSQENVFTNFNVTVEQNPQLNLLTPAEYADVAAEQLALMLESTTLDGFPLEIGGVEAYGWVLEYELSPIGPPADIIVVQYAIKHNGVIWTLTYTTLSDEYAIREEEFSASAQSLRFSE